MKLALIGILACALLLVSAAGAPVLAQDTAPADSSSDAHRHNPYDLSKAAAAEKDDVYVSNDNPFLALPSYLWTVLVHPLGQFAIYAEHGKLMKRYYEFFTNAAGTFGVFPQVQFGGETGTGGGGRLFLVDLWGRGSSFEALYIYSGGNGQLAQGRYVAPGALGRNFALEIDGEYMQTRNEGATINAALPDDSGHLFQLEQVDLEGTLKWRRNAGPLAPFRRNWGIDAWAGAGHRDFQVREGDPRTVARGEFTPEASRLVGLGEAIRLYRFGGRVLYDDRDYKTPARAISHPLNYRFPGRILTFVDGLYHSYRDLGYPERGGLVSAEAEYVTGSDDVKFSRFQAEIQRYFTVFWSNRVLALRARLEKVSRVGRDGIVPHTELPYRGGTSNLRGYRRGAFRGMGTVVLNVEYRYPIWDYWNAFVFWDEGQAFDRYGDIERGRFWTSWGGGIAFRTPVGLLGKVQAGHSAAEKVLVRAAVRQEF